MRIVRLVNLYPPYIVGGNEMLTRDIVEALRARGHSVHVLTARGQLLTGIPQIHQVFNYNLDQKDEIFLGHRKLTPVELFRHYVFDGVTYRQVRRVVKQLQLDLIVADNLYMASTAPLLAVRDAECPVIAQVADRWLLFNLMDWSAAIRPQTRFQRWLANAIRDGIQRPLARKVRLDGIATISNFIRNLYLDAGFAPEILETTYLGIHNEVFYPGPEHPLSDPVRLMFAGALWEGKGPQVAVQALRILSQRDDLPRFHLDFFGDGAEGFKQYLRRVIANAGVELRVTIHGFVPWARLVQAMHQSDIFLFPSVWDEPFAITPLQALGCGLPVVATRTGGTPEGLTDGETALLIPPNDPQAMAEAVIKLVRQPELYKKLRETGVKEAQERWSFQSYMDRLLDFYERVIIHWRKGRRCN